LLRQAGAAGIHLHAAPAGFVVHRERYDDLRLGQEIFAYDARRHERFPIAPQKQCYVAEYGTADYYPWSENAARQLPKAECADFHSSLHRHGFTLA
jgi:hypothetical protein